MIFGNYIQDDELVYDEMRIVAPTIEEAITQVEKQHKDKNNLKIISCSSRGVVDAICVTNTNDNYLLISRSS